MNGGFDCVIGNPPYLNTKRGFAEKSEMNFYLKQKYKTAKGQFDAYSIFIERALNLLHSNGALGFIVPKPILTNENMSDLRKLILESGSITNIADFGTPFKDASVEGVAICHSKIATKNNKINVHIKINGTVKIGIVKQDYFLKTPNFSFTIKTNSKTETLLRKIEKDKIQFKELVEVFVRGIEGGKKDEAINFTKNKKNNRPLLRGQDVKKYDTNFQNIYVEVDFNDTKKFKHKNIYEVEKKLLIRRVGSDLQATIDTEGFWNLNTIYNVQLKNSDYEFILGIFNSKLISFWFKKRFVFEDKLFPYARVSQLETIPIPANPDKILYDEIVRFVAQLLQLNKELQTVTLPNQIQQIKSRIAYCEDKIDAAVYELYGLTDEEIGVVENR
jgi:hypothetical protein